MQSQEWRQQDVYPIAEANQVVRNEQSDSTEGDAGEQLEATTKQPRGQGESHAAN
jgi:hypothetical protein